MTKLIDSTKVTRYEPRTEAVGTKGGLTAQFVWFQARISHDLSSEEKAFKVEGKCAWGRDPGLVVSVQDPAMFDQQGSSKLSQEGIVDAWKLQGRSKRSSPLTGDLEDRCGREEHGLKRRGERREGIS